MIEQCLKPQLTRDRARLVGAQARLSFCCLPKGHDHAHVFVTRSSAERVFVAWGGAVTEVQTVLKKAYDHLEYCGFGDNWERSIATDTGLPDLIQSTIVKWDKEPDDREG